MPSRLHIRAALVALSLTSFLTACQGTNPATPFGDAAQNLDRSISAEECGQLNVTQLNWKKGGTITILPVSQQGLYGGTIWYTPLPKGYYTLYSEGCIYDFANIPVPAGYLYDWFGQVSLGSGEQATFNGSARAGQMYSNLWKRNRTYFLYLYTPQGQFIHSYQIGPLRDHERELEFASPFQNGFVLSGQLELEIVHPAAE